MYHIMICSYLTFVCQKYFYHRPIFATFKWDIHYVSGLNYVLLWYKWRMVNQSVVYGTHWQMARHEAKALYGAYQKSLQCGHISTNNKQILLLQGHQPMQNIAKHIDKLTHVHMFILCFWETTNYVSWIIAINLNWTYFTI